jgi:predicted RND superfamily exporter protein
VDRIFDLGRKHPIVAIGILVVGCVLAGLNVNKLFIDSSTESLMVKGDPARLYYEETLEIFGSDSMMMIYVEDKDLFSVEKLGILERLVGDLSNKNEFPGIVRVESLYSVSNLKGYPDYLDNNPLMDYPPETEEEAQAVKENALRNPVLINNLVSESGSATVINLYLAPRIIGFDKDLGTKTVRDIGKLLHNDDSGYASHYEKVFEIGRPYMSEEITDLILQDMVTIVPIAFVVLLIMLVVTMGSLNSALLPFLTSSLSILFTVGFMGATGLPFNLLTFIVPILVIVIGSTEDVHILSEYMTGLQHTGGRKSAVAFMAKAVGTAVFLTSLTTFLGFLSISINRITVLTQFGLVAGFAMLVNPITTSLVAPLFLRYFGAKSFKDRSRKEGPIHRFIQSIAGLSIRLTKHKQKKVLICVLVLVILGGFFSIFITVDNDTVSYFRKGSDITRRLATLHEELSGAQTFFIRIRRPTIDDFLADDRVDGTSEPVESAADDITDLFADSDEELDIFGDSESDDLFAELPSDVAADSTVGAGNRNLFHDPRYLRMLDDIQTVFREEFDFDITISVADYVKLLHREMNVGQPGDYYSTPDPADPRSDHLIAQYALNLHHDEISSYITSDWSEANILVRHNISSSSDVQAAVARAEAAIRGILAQVDPLLQFEITGESILINKAADSITKSQIAGLSLLLLTILIIMSVLFLNIKAGLLALIPNIFPIFIFFGIMGIFKIPLNLGTCMVAAIGIGISVDDTIHFMTRFNHEMRARQDRAAAVEAVILSEIRPIISTSFAVVLGFGILVFAQMMPILNFDILSGVVMICALIADLLITPILLSSFQLTNIADIAATNVAIELQDSPIFAGMTMLEIKKFTLLGKTSSCEAGEYLIKTGDPGKKMFILLSGSATVKREDPETGESLYISDLSAGSILGEISLLQNVARTASVVAKEAVTYLEIDWSGLTRLQRSAKAISTKLYRNIAAVLGRRLVEMTDKMQELQKGAK